LPKRSFIESHPRNKDLKPSRSNENKNIQIAAAAGKKDCKKAASPLFVKVNLIVEKSTANKENIPQNNNVGKTKITKPVLIDKKNGRKKSEVIIKSHEYLNPRNPGSSTSIEKVFFSFLKSLTLTNSMD